MNASIRNRKVDEDHGWSLLWKANFGVWNICRLTSGHFSIFPKLFERYHQKHTHKICLFTIYSFILLVKIALKVNLRIIIDEICMENMQHIEWNLTNIIRERALSEWFFCLGHSHLSWKWTKMNNDLFVIYKLHSINMSIQFNVCNMFTILL